MPPDARRDTRLARIYAVLREHGDLGPAALLQALSVSPDSKTSHRTLTRDLDHLVESGNLRRTRAGQYGVTNNETDAPVQECQTECQTVASGMPNGGLECQVLASGMPNGGIGNANACPPRARPFSSPSALPLEQPRETTAAAAAAVFSRECQNLASGTPKLGIECQNLASGMPNAPGNANGWDTSHATLVRIVDTVTAENLELRREVAMLRAVLAGGIAPPAPSVATPDPGQVFVEVTHEDEDAIGERFAQMREDGEPVKKPSVMRRILLDEFSRDPKARTTLLKSAARRRERAADELEARQRLERERREELILAAKNGNKVAQELLRGSPHGA